MVEDIDDLNEFREKRLLVALGTMEKAFKENDVEIPYPQRTIHLKKTD